MKTLLSQIRFIAAFIIIMMISVGANSQTVISSIGAENSVKILSEQMSKSSKTKTIELKQENWMSNKGYLDFDSKLSMSDLFFVYEEVREQDKKVEDWMSENASWQLKKKSEQNDILEQPRKLEEWMLDNNFWKIKREDEHYPLERWMTDSKFWVMVD
ncbi:MAG: hypothetical protein KQH79_09040 [Bacteroidetes bacterium]|nr:hypothetical protein [Bacteroidota bacterium]